MSIDLFYPWNRPRAARVEQLITQIGVLQSELVKSIDTGEGQMTHARKMLDEYLKNNGLKSIDDLKKKAEGTLTEEQKKTYRDMMASFEEYNGELSIDFEIISAIGAIAGTVAAGAKYIEFVQAGGIAMSAKLAARGLAKVLGKDAEVGIRMMEAAMRGLRSFIKGWDMSETALKAIKMIKLAGEIIGVIAIVLDGFLAILAAVQGDKQRTALRDAINDLIYRRFSTMELRKLGKVYEAYVGNMYKTIVQYTAADSVKNKEKEKKEKEKTEEEKKKEEMWKQIMKQIMDDSIQLTIKDLKEESDKIKFETTYDDVAALDAQSNSFTNEDPQRADIKDWYETEKNPKKFEKDH